jgi:hypothetical protein
MMKILQRLNDFLPFVAAKRMYVDAVNKCDTVFDWAVLRKHCNRKFDLEKIYRPWQ